MKRIILIFWLLPLVAQALDRSQLDSMLSEAAKASGNTYLEDRQKLVATGTNALPLLAQAATDGKLTWQQRLVARICYERIVRADEIEALRRYDWRTHPQYDKEWEKYIVGPGIRMVEITVPQCAKFGLWYYYIELGWKDTKESAVKPFDSRINDTRILSDSWLGWCLSAVQGLTEVDYLIKLGASPERTRLNVPSQPEGYYLTRTLIERLESDTKLSEPINVSYYRYLLHKKESDAVPVLVQRYDAFFKREVTGPEVFPGSHAITYCGKFKPILNMADSRHVKLLDQFIADKKDLAALKDKLDAVRARPAPPPSEEPPFRLGQEPVKP